MKHNSSFKVEVTVLRLCCTAPGWAKTWRLHGDICIVDRKNLCMILCWDIRLF